jgi:hypothetical protein
MQERKFHSFSMIIKEDHSEWAEEQTTPLELDVNTIVGFWTDADGGTCLDTETDSYKVTEDLETVKAILNDI